MIHSVLAEELLPETLKPHILFALGKARMFQSGSTGRF